MTRVPPRGLLPVVEACYRTDLDSKAWLDGVLAEVDRSVGRGLGACGFLLDASDLGDIRVEGFEPSRLKVPLDPRAFFDVSAGEASPYYATRAAGTGSGQVGGARPWRRSRVYEEFYRPVGAEDVIGLIGVDANRKGCVVAVPCPRITRLKARDELALSRIAAHIATGHRLRTGLPARTSVEAAAEAVLDPSGRVLDAKPAAKGRLALDSLRSFALRLDRARARTKRGSSDEALAVWTALVEARWTLLDQFDSDGRRYLVAVRNDPRVRGTRALTARERQVVAYTALGHPGKLIAYELGISDSAVSQHLASAMAKLGVRSRAALAATLGRLAAENARRPRNPEGAERSRLQK